MIALEKNYTTISSHPFAKVMLDNDTQQLSLVSTHYFTVNDVVATFNAEAIYSIPNYLTVQIGENQHVTLSPSFLQYINHSCEPNVFFDTSMMQLICLQPIAAGDEFCFFYPSSEWDMAQPFVCHCGTPSCIALISGAAHVDKDVIGQYRVTDFIAGQLLDGCPRPLKG